MRPHSDGLTTDPLGDVLAACYRRMLAQLDIGENKSESQEPLDLAALRKDVEDECRSGGRKPNHEN